MTEAPSQFATPKPEAAPNPAAVPKPEAAPKPEAPPKPAAVFKEAPKPTGETSSPSGSPSPVASMLAAAAASPVRTATPVMTAAPFKDGQAIWWRSPLVIVVGLGTVVILLGILLWPTGSSSSGSNQVTSASEPVHAAAVPAPATPVDATPAPKPAATTASAPPAAATAKPSAPPVAGSMRVELVASEPSWVSVRAGDGTTLMSGLIEPGKSQSVDIRQTAVLRAGNAGGLTIRANGKSLGPLGPHGAVRDVEFKNGDFKLIPVQ